MKPVVALLALILTAATATVHASPAWSAATIVGHWYGEGWQPYLQQDAQWLDDFRADGTYAMTLRLSQDCRTIQTLSNAGTWKFEDGVLSMTIKELDGAPLALTGYIYDTYRMQTMSGEGMSFLHDQSGTLFAVRRVSAHFHLPSCLTS